MHLYYIGNNFQGWDCSFHISQISNRAITLDSRLTACKAWIRAIFRFSDNPSYNLSCVITLKQIERELYNPH